jgi:hypothetical protein
MVARLVVIGQPGGPVFFALLLDDLGAGNDRIAPPSQMGWRCRFKACRDRAARRRCSSLPASLALGLQKGRELGFVKVMWT